ncbi:MAG: leucine-rich repeat domain-containing protein [Alistipes sp.]|nr:leucine-rich repeat domain-containing protein [Alistipes sp.]
MRNFFLLLLVWLLAACSETTETEIVVMPSNPTGTETLSSDVELTDETVLINNAQLAFLQAVDEANSTLEFSASLPAEYHPEVGEILLRMAPTEKLPYGFIGRVTEVKEVGGKLVVKTEAPTLAEAFSRLIFEEEIEIKPADSRVFSYEDGYVPFDPGTITAKKGGFSASYHVVAGIGGKLKLVMAFDAKKNQDRFELILDTKQKADYKLKAALKSKEYEKMSGDIGGGIEIPSPAKVIGLKVKMQPRWVLKAQGEAVLNLDATIQRNQTQRAYRDGIWTKVEDITPDSNTPFGKISAEADAGVSLEGEIFGGIEAAFELSFLGRDELKVEIAPELGAKLTGELSAELISNGYEAFKDTMVTTAGVFGVSASSKANLFTWEAAWSKPLVEFTFLEQSNYLFPDFTEGKYELKDDGVADGSVQVSRDLFWENDIAIAQYDQGGNLKKVGGQLPYKYAKNFSNPLSAQFMHAEEDSYWSVIKWGGDYLKCRKLIGEDDLRDMLIKFYYDTGGDNWTHNDNWCSDKPLNEWCGVYVYTDDAGRRRCVLNLRDNNLVGMADLSGCTALEDLCCYNNQLKSLNVSGCTALADLDCSGNELTSLNVSGCTAMNYLNCSGNQLTSLNVSGCAAMEVLYCFHNQLTSLNVSGCTALAELRCYDNQLTSLHVSGCTALEDLECNYNQLTSLDVSGCTALADLRCSSNQLTSLNVSGCTAMKHLYCDNNQLKSLNVSGCAALEDLVCDYNQLTSLNVSGCAALKNLHCNNNQLTSLNVSGCTALDDLYCFDNQLTSLNVSGCTALEYLYCSGNQLTSLNVSGCAALADLDCSGNQLTSLNVSGCAAMEVLYCFHNQLTSLNVSGCTALADLYCSDNPITQMITELFLNIPVFSYDQRFYYDNDGNWSYKYDDGHGWYYSGEPYKGYHGE